MGRDLGGLLCIYTLKKCKKGWGLVGPRTRQTKEKEKNAKQSVEEIFFSFSFFLRDDDFDFSFFDFPKRVLRAKWETHIENGKWGTRAGEEEEGGEEKRVPKTLSLLSPLPSFAFFLFF